MSGLRGVRILIVEDEPLIAMAMSEELSDFGAEIVCVAETLDEAQHAAQHGNFDIGVLDINLNGWLSYPAAETLVSRGLPFVFASGFASKPPPANLAHAPFISKPFRWSVLVNALVETLAQSERMTTAMFKAAA